MAIDASVYGAIKPFETPNPLAQFAQIEQLQGARQQNRLAELMFAEKQKESAGTEARNAAYSKAYNPATGEFSANALYRNLAEANQGGQIPAAQKAEADRQKSLNESESTKLKLTGEKLGLAAQFLGASKDQNSYTQAIAAAKANGLDVSTLPPQYDPAVVQQRLNQALTAKDQVDQTWKAKNFGLEQEKFGETKRNNQVQNGISAGNLGVARANLGLRQQELENGKNQIVQSDNGPVLVNTRTGAGKVVNGPDGQPLPGVTKPLNDSQSKALLFGSRMREADNILNTLEKEGTKVSVPGSRAPFVGGAINAISPENNQMLDQAKRDFMTAILRRESGAAISSGEYDTADKQYFPQIGEGPKQIEQKARNRQLAIDGVLTEVPEKQRNSLQPRTAATAAPSGPKVGTVQDGYRFKGGNPADQSNWVKQ